MERIDENEGLFAGIDTTEWRKTVEECEEGDPAREGEDERTGELVCERLDSAQFFCVSDSLGDCPCHLSLKCRRP